MIQLINIFLALIIFFQIVYLFTCGQPYVEKRAKRSGINILIVKVIHIMGAASVIINSVLSEKNTIWETLMYACVAFVLFDKVRLAKRIYNRLRND